MPELNQETTTWIIIVAPFVCGALVFVPFLFYVAHKWKKGEAGKITTTMYERQPALTFRRQTYAEADIQAMDMARFNATHSQTAFVESDAEPVVVFPDLGPKTYRAWALEPMSDAEAARLDARIERTVKQTPRTAFVGVG